MHMSNYIEPPKGLFEKIMFRIRKEKKLLTIRRRIVLFSSIMVISIIAFVPAFKAVQKDIIDSGFWQFFSLLFSDFSIVAVYWQNFAMSLLETIPALSLAILFLVIFAFMESFKELSYDLKSVFSLKKLAEIKN